jgi:hypothetical protein
MNNIDIDKIDDLFKSYNYIISPKSNHQVRIYTLRYGMYHAAEIILVDQSFDPSKIKADFSELGYATEIKNLTDNLNLEEYLFEGFFIKTPLGNELKTRYSQFVSKQIKNLPEGSQYKYIESSYDFLFQDETGGIVEQQYVDATENNLIPRLNKLLSETKGALFVIIEAAAGFGKTCTAYEVLNTFSSQDSKKLPFFTELSRNREARIFKHILLQEIDDQFPNGIKQNIVIDQIIKGRIPLIIDGFDELITKESNKEEVESMLTTIVELLQGEAKIIITSRKTAIFNSEEFLDSINSAKNDFSLVRIEIKEPTINNWLDSDRLEIIEQTNFPIEQISNPVLLSYLRNISIEKLKTYAENNSEENSLIDKYIDYLLKREQLRQNLKLNNETQLRIFRKLMRLMTEFNITTDSKETIKELLKDYNRKIIKQSLKEYLADEKPSVDDLIETLSNHVFLDRKANGSIGIINDFIFGLLVGENLIYEKYQQYDPLINKNLPLDFAQKALQSFQIQSPSRKEKLWNVFDKGNFDYDANFFFDLDYSFKKCSTRNYSNLYVNDIIIDEFHFCENQKFIECGFSNIVFKNCRFHINFFEKTSFHNCEFYNCIIETKTKISFKDFGVFACTSNNDFLNILSSNIAEKKSIKNEDIQIITEVTVLSHFFSIDNKKPRARKLSQIKVNYTEDGQKELGRIVTSLKSQGLIFIKDDVGFISKTGISIYNQNRNQV